MYQTLIREILARLGRLGTEPRHVEAIMRLDHSTLDGLSAAAFECAVIDAADDATFNPQNAEALARSFGL